MIKRDFFVALIVFCFSGTAFAWVSDSAGPPAHKFSFMLQVGQPNHIIGADVIDADQPFTELHGQLDRFSIGTGGLFRWHVDESFFLHARVMYSTRRYSLYDSIREEPVIETFPNWTNTTSRTYVVDNNYKMVNFLFGLGGGHEGHYGRFIVRAGGEIDFIKYADVRIESASRNYENLHSDTIAGGTRVRDQLLSFHDLTISPGLWAIGLVGHASLEYKVAPTVGIGASIYLGGFYCGSKGKTWSQQVENIQTTTDSGAPTTINETNVENALEYNVRQFDFAPLNAQMNFVYYFGQ